MSCKIDMKPEGDLLIVTLRGDSSPEREVTDFQVMLDRCVESGLSKVLIDYRELVGITVNPGEVFHYITQVNNLYFRHIRNGGNALRMVYLSPMVEDVDEQFSLTVAKNFGFPAMLTFNWEQAMEWLESTS